MKNLEQLAVLATSLPANLKDNASTLVATMGEIIEGFGDKPLEWSPSNLKLVQATTDRTKIPKTAGIGSLLLGETVLEQPFKVIPIRIDTTRQYWNPDNTKAQMLCSSPDAKFGFMYGDCYQCPHSKFDEEANRSACNKSVSILCATADLTDVFNVTFTKTNYVNGTDWRGLMAKLKTVPYRRFYNLTTESSPKAKNVEIIKAAGILNEKVEGPLFDFVEELFKLSKATREDHLLKFYQYLDAKKEKSVLSLASPTSTIALISDQSDDPEVDILPPEAGTKTVTSAAKKYNL